MKVIVRGKGSIAPDYPQRLALIRRRRRDHDLAMGFLFVYLPLGLWFGPKVGLSIWIVLLSFWLLFGVSRTRISACRCPRCEERFFPGGILKSPASRTCSHCGLSLDGPEPRIVLLRAGGTEVVGARSAEAAGVPSSRRSQG
jgi:hypothetical protein